MNALTLLKLAVDWQAAGAATSCAVVLETFGSAPRPKGSMLVMADDGRFEGSVSGGCIENEVMIQARDLGAAKQLDFDISDETALLNGLPCGGAMKVLVFPVAVFRPQIEGAIAQLQHGEMAPLTIADHQINLEPAPRLIIVGAVHIAQILSQMAALSGFEVTVVDPRPAYANAERFPGVALVRDWPDEAIKALKPDAATAIVTLAHDGKFDIPALQAALDSPAFYIGALGSRKTQTRRREALGDRTDLHCIHGPVGLNIGAQTPAEIAHSILAEITQKRRSPKAASAIATLILAAGTSSRLGEKDKLTLPIESRPILEWTLRAALAAACGPVFVVTQPGTLLPELAGVHQIPNPDFSDGMSSSVRVGISAIQRHAQAVKGVMVLPADKPHIQWRTLDDLAKAADNTPLRATYHGTPGHPAYLPAHLFPALLALEGDQGAKSLDLTWHELSLDDPAIVEDVDTWDDYERILTHWPNSS